MLGVVWQDVVLLWKQARRNDCRAYKPKSEAIQQTVIPTKIIHQKGDTNCYGWHAAGNSLIHPNNTLGFPEPCSPLSSHIHPKGLQNV
jgi:hypothetical protein